MLTMCRLFMRFVMILRNITRRRIEVEVKIAWIWGSSLSGRSRGDVVLQLSNSELLPPWLATQVTFIEFLISTVHGFIVQSRCIIAI